MKVLLIDNYDSFTYNLFHYLEDLGATTTVIRNDQLSIEEVAPFDRIMLSPGPGIPSEAGLLKSIIKAYAHKKPIFGVCLGLQAIVEVFGGTIINLEKVYHGIDSEVEIALDDETLFKGLPKRFMAGRYHSWVASKDFPKDLEITSLDEKGNIMSIRHKTLNIKGVQFHPESILTPHGKTIIANWLKYN